MRCSRSKPVPRVQQTLEQQKEREASLLFEQALTPPCPKCGRRDKLTRQGFGNLIDNLRCSRCSLRIAFRKK